MCHSRDICAQVDAFFICRKSHCPGRSPEGDGSLTFDLCRFGVCKQNLAEIRREAAEMRVAAHTDRQTDGQTDGQTAFLYT